MKEKTHVAGTAYRYLMGAAALVVIVAGLRAAKPLMVPFLLSIFLAILCVPAVTWLVNKRMPRGLAVLVVIVGMLGVLTGIGALVGGSVSQFNESLPLYQRRLEHLANAVITWLNSLGIHASTKRALQAIDVGAAMSLVGGTLKGLASALSNLVVVLLTMIFILLEAAGFPAKVRAALGDPDADLGQYEKMVTDVKRYLAIKTGVSLGTGVLAAVWTAVLGVDFALLWGLTAFLFNYIPNLGSILAAVPPVLLAIVQFGVGRALLVAAGYVAINMALGNVLEPMLMGRKLGLSTLVVFLSLIVWGWILGPVGMLLSVPLTMVVKIAMENSENYRWVATLLDVAPKKKAPKDEGKDSDKNRDKDKNKANDTNQAEGKDNDTDSDKDNHKDTTPDSPTPSEA